jgi:hypothetical protein
MLYGGECNGKGKLRLRTTPIDVSLYHIIHFNTSTYFSSSPQTLICIFSISVSLSHHTHPKSIYRYLLHSVLRIFHPQRQTQLSLFTIHYPTSSTSQTAHYQRHEMSFRTMKFFHFLNPALQAWRVEAFENTLTYSDFETYLIVHLDEMISSFLRFKIGKSKGCVGSRERHCAEYKALILSLDHRRWWRKQKLRAIEEALFQQEEQEA